MNLIKLFFPKAWLRLLQAVVLVLAEHPDEVADAARQAVRDAAELEGAAGADKREHAARQLAQALDDLVDWREILPNGWVGQVAEWVDGPVFRAACVPLIELAYRAEFHWTDVLEAVADASQPRDEKGRFAPKGA